MTHLPAMGMCFRKRGLEILFAKRFYGTKTFQFLCFVVGAVVSLYGIQKAK